jgi:hypothetical protein
MHLLLLCLLVAGAPVAAAAADGDGSARPKLLGAQLSAGFPQGFGAAVVVRPLPWLRAHAGFAHNILGPGIQGGVTLAPWQFAIVPTLTLEAGRFFQTDVSDDFSGTFPDAFDPSLRRFGYDFYSAQLGLEVGSQRSFVFFLRGGLAWLRSGLDGVSGFRPEGSDTIVDVADLRLRAVVPTVNLGLVFYIW